MANRFANIILLCEDQEHQNLVYRYLLHAGHNNRSFRKMPLPGSKQCGSQYVRETFPEQVKECRNTLGRKASCLLIVITDADNLTVNQREQTLHAELARTGVTPVATTDPIVVLIPKWQVETWIKCALGQVISEDDANSDRPPVNATQIKQGVQTIFDWARPGAQIGATCVDSLRTALPRWLRIG